jgi:hypothetical protein
VERSQGSYRPGIDQDRWSVRNHRHQLQRELPEALAKRTARQRDGNKVEI